MSSAPSENDDEYRTVSEPGYSLRGDRRADEHHKARQAERQAEFLLPYLSSGLDLLDCGCGPGTITVGLAQIVAPGHVVGVDLDTSALKSARKLAHENRLGNVRFEEGNVYELPFADASFDVAFSHAVFEHLEDPILGLREMHRVIKADGLAAVRVPDLDGWLISPCHPLQERFLLTANEYRTQHGADMRRGKAMRRLFREAQFVDIQMTASYESHGTPESIQAFVTTWFPADYEASADPLVKAGLMDSVTLASCVEAWRSWSSDPDAFLARSFCEVTGRKSSDRRLNA